MSNESRFKKDFPGLTDRVYLNTGAEGIPPASCLQALEEYLAAKALGAEGRPRLYEEDGICKRKLAEFLGVAEHEVALLGNASECLNRLCNSIDWKQGDEIVIDDLEFPSNVLCWIRLREKGVKVHVVRNRDWILNPDDFAPYLNARTKLVSVSHVSYLSGARLDIEQIGRLARSVGALYCVDATQSMGRVPIPIKEIDYLVASTYKWLLAPHGGGVVFCSSKLLQSLQPGAAGWWSVKDLFSPDRFERIDYKPGAARFELGMPNFLATFALSQSLSYLNEAQVAEFDRELQPVCDFLMEELGKLPLRLMTPIEPNSRAGLVSFEHADCESIAGQLAREKIYVWGGDGRVRVSIHLYNDFADAEAFLKKLIPAIGRRKW